jgi:predicted MFS family arabinose efflux permease
MPLVLAAAASQALLVVLGPTLSSVAGELGTSSGEAGQARSTTALAAIAASVLITTRVDVLGVPRLLRLGGALAVVSSAAVAVSPTLLAFLVAHVLVGLALGCLLSAAFAGVASFPPQRSAWAIGYVAGANALAWVLVNPITGLLTGWLGWRAAESVPPWSRWRCCWLHEGRSRCRTLRWPRGCTPCWPRDRCGAGSSLR